MELITRSLSLEVGFDWHNGLRYEGSHIIIKHKSLFIALHFRIKSFPPKIPSSMYENQDSRLEAFPPSLLL